jgi:UDPglucose--hexose-1-phosphate uridylyltransferase
MYSDDLLKADGRSMTLYSRRPIPTGLQAPTPNSAALDPQPHFRFHPLRNEWVAFAAHRQARTFLPPPEWNPLAPMTSPEVPTEMPVGDYDAAVFPNLFPSLAMTARGLSEQKGLNVETAPAKGVCEVVVFAQDSHSTLGGLPLSHIELIFEIWGDRTRRIKENSEIRYIMPFENRGVEMGVTLHHPHGQIYAYPFIPPLAARELQSQSDYFKKNSVGLLEKMAKDEIDEKTRLVYSGPSAVSFVPVCARYPYETWVMPRRRVALISDLTAPERSDLARALKTTLMKYDALWQKPFPYLMILHQGAVNTAAESYVGSHVHFEIYPALRTRDRLKYLAGTELGAGMFANDTLPEEKAAELKAVEVYID